MQEFSLEALLDLYSVPGIGAAKMRSLISFFGTPQNVLKASERQLIQIDGIDKLTAQRIKSARDPNFVSIQMKQLENGRIKILTYWDEQYPDCLKRIYDPPAFLFTKGNQLLFDTLAIGIVGSRTPSGYGKMLTQKLTAELVQNGFTIISGFARGIDTIAHKTALEKGGTTIAVLGNGLDIVYPSENKHLMDVFGSNGLIISEYPFGTKPDAINFPKRNRLISGLSIGVLVTEAAAKSGALLTAMYALDQNREVFALPGPVSSPKSTGTNNLIKQGAKLVQTIDDILAEFTSLLNLKNFYVQKSEPEPKLNDAEKQVYQLLAVESLHIDQIALKAGITTSEALNILLILELKGHIRQMAGKMFTRI